MLTIDKENYYLLILYLGFLYIYVMNPEPKLIINYPELNKIENLTLIESDVEFKIQKQN